MILNHPTLRPTHPQHCTLYGVMIAFKFGSIVYVQPRRSTPRGAFLDVPEAAAGSSGRGVVGGGGLAEGPAAAARAAEKLAAATSAQLQQELTRAVRTAVTDPVLTKARMEGVQGEREGLLTRGDDFMTMNLRPQNLPLHHSSTDCHPLVIYLPQLFYQHET